ncbi:MAG: YhcH/YjgK/YiaL family protein [Lentisphaeria bacterium]
MIYDSLASMKNYYKGNQAWDKVINFIESLSTTSETGKHVIDGDLLFAFVSRYNTRSAEGAEMETHQRYIDVQILLEGTELIGFEPFDSGCSSTVPHSMENDIAFFTPGKYDTVTLRPGVFGVFYPDEFHMPQLNAGDESKPVMKVVVKVDRTLL